MWLCSNVGGPVGPPARPDTRGVVNGGFSAGDIRAIVAQGRAAGDLNALPGAGNAALLYANLHTESFGGGAIRGQID